MSYDDPINRIDRLEAALARIEAALEFNGVLSKRPSPSTIVYSGMPPSYVTSTHYGHSGNPMTYARMHHPEQLVQLVTSKDPVTGVHQVAPVPLGTSEGQPDEVPQHLAGIWSK